MAKNRPENLTLKQEKAIIALLNENSVGRAAEVVGVGQRTLYRWIDEPDFSRAFRKARRDAFGQAIALTQRYAPLAVHTLAKVMSDQDSPASAKVAAATTLLRFGREGVELDDLAACRGAGGGGGSTSDGARRMSAMSLRRRLEKLEDRFIPTVTPLTQEQLARLEKMAEEVFAHPEEWPEEIVIYRALQEGRDPQEAVAALRAP